MGTCKYALHIHPVHPPMNVDIINMLRLCGCCPVSYAIQLSAMLLHSDEFRGKGAVGADLPR